MDRDIALTALALALSGSAPSPAQTARSFDTAKAIEYGAGLEAILPVAQDDSVGAGVCETVEIASAPLRLARASRAAKANGRTLEPEAAARAARPTLSVIYFRQPFRTESMHFVSRPNGILSPPDARAPTPCPEDRRPQALVLVGPSGELLSPVAPAAVHERQWTGKRGASGTTFDVTAEFHLEKALALGTGKGLEVRVLYEEGKPTSFRFPRKKLEELFPRWAK